MALCSSKRIVPSAMLAWNRVRWTVMSGYSCTTSINTSPTVMVTPSSSRHSRIRASSFVSPGSTASSFAVLGRRIRSVRLDLAMRLLLSPKSRGFSGTPQGSFLTVFFCCSKCSKTAYLCGFSGFFYFCEDQLKVVKNRLRCTPVAHRLHTFRKNAIAAHSFFLSLYGTFIWTTLSGVRSSKVSTSTENRSSMRTGA